MLITLLLLVGCDPDISVTKHDIDHDSDGYDVEVDCDDSHATVHPDADETCDGIDNDCDGVVDEDPTDGETFYADADGDGAGAEATTTVACEAPDGFVPDTSDCDDAEPRTFPGNAEVCDGIDNNCDGGVDDDATDVTTFYADDDADGYGDPALPLASCEAPAGYAVDGSDCDDGDAAIHPDAAETDCTDPTDYNCDGSVAWADADLDGSPACEDCDDTDPLRSPALVEACDEADVDEDCDGNADDLDEEATGRTTWSRDRDADAYGDAGSDTLTTCEQPAGYAADATDCDDYDSATNPGGTEVCDAFDLDEDCDGLSDDADASVSAGSWSTWYRDLDADTYGDAAYAVSQCDAPAGWVADDGDCDDAAADQNPAATEVCDEAGDDEDCDGLANEDDPSVTGTSDWYPDGDGDGHGTGAVYAACQEPTGYAAVADDCDDADAAVHPDATELCDAANADEDCDGLADDADTAPSGRTTWYADGDGDAYGLASSTTSACDMPSGYAAASGDCDDASVGINPGATEVCDPSDTDEDCDGLADDADASVSGLDTWYRDTDGDGYGVPTRTAAACEEPAGYVANADDCDDASAAISPAAAEICDSSNADEDCDGAADDADGSATGETTWHRDQDGDTYGSATVTTATCDLPAGYVANDDDCDDYDAGAYQDTTWYADTDNDGYGDASSWVSACGEPAGYVADATDCDDGSASVSPGQTEVCANDIDDDCDGEVDESCTFAGTYEAEEYDAKIYGESGADLFGTSLAGGFDFDDDGIDDLVVGAPGDDDGGGGYGAAYVYSGDVVASGASRADTSDLIKVYGTSTYDDVGVKVWAVRDLEADGDDEIVVFGDLTNSYSNLVLGTSASSTGTIEAADYSAHTCDEVASAGDSNSTLGQDDWLCAQQSYATYTGRTYIYDGLSVAAGTLVGESTSDYSGYALAGGQDFDGDGYDDYVVGAPGDDDAAAAAGAAYIVYAPVSASSVTSLASADVKLTGAAAADYFGYNVLSPGDMDGDGYADLLVGAEKDDAGRADAGAIYLFSSPSSGSATTADARLYGADSADYLGNNDYGFMSVGDTDGDGAPDLLVGTSYSDPNGSASGQAWLLYGPHSGTYDLSLTSGYDARFQGTEAGDGFGQSGTMASDIDNDGRDDVVIGASYGDEAAYSDYGAIYVFYGR